MSLEAKIKTHGKKGRVALLALIERHQYDALKLRAYQLHKSMAYVVRQTLDIGMLPRKEYDALVAYSRMSERKIATIVQEALDAYLKSHPI